MLCAECNFVMHYIQYSLLCFLASSRLYRRKTKSNIEKLCTIRPRSVVHYKNVMTYFLLVCSIIMMYFWKFHQGCLIAGIVWFWIGFLLYWSVIMSSYGASRIQQVGRIASICPYEWKWVLPLVIPTTMHSVCVLLLHSRQVYCLHPVLPGAGGWPEATPSYSSTLIHMFKEIYTADWKKTSQNIKQLMCQESFLQLHDTQNQKHYML